MSEVACSQGHRAWALVPACVATAILAAVLPAAVALPAAGVASGGRAAMAQPAAHRGCLAHARPDRGASATRRLVLSASSSTMQPRTGEMVTVTVGTRDRGGRPVEGARVVVAWALPSGLVEDARTTGRSGTLTFARAIGAATAGATIRLVVTARWRGQTRRAALVLTVAAEPPPAEPRLEPGDLVYRGAFRLPGPSGGSSWGWSGDGLTYFPAGDTGGEADGYPGSLFGIGHDWQHYISEVSIPAPVISADKDPADLPVASTLQPFADVKGSLYPNLSDELRCADVEYLPSPDRLFLCWGWHMELGEANATHMSCSLDLSDPQPVGPWSIGGLEDYVTCDYLFAVDPAWAAARAPGKLLATGRFRDGGQGTMGPSILLFAPPAAGSTAGGATLTALPLLFYDNVWNGGADILRGYQHSDEWAGAAWLTSGDRGAVVFAGTKGTGACWYGFADGTVWPDEPPYPPVPPDGERGWWSTGFTGELLFYDPADLAAVAAGTMRPNQPQPYAALALDPYLFAVHSGQQKHHVGAIAFDRAHGRLYVMEPLADGDDSIVHVWQVVTAP